MAMLFFAEGFTFRNFLVDVFAVFIFILWFWLLIIVIGDLFRRHDISGWVKAIWVIALIVFPYLGIFAYLITQSRGMAERSSQQAAQAREELRRVVGFSAADEIEKLDRLKKSGSITDQEFARLRAKLVASGQWRHILQQEVLHLLKLVKQFGPGWRPSHAYLATHRALHEL